MDANEKSEIRGLLDKPVATLTVREAIRLLDAIDHATEEELAELELPTSLNI